MNEDTNAANIPDAAARRRTEPTRTTHRLKFLSVWPSLVDDDRRKKPAELDDDGLTAAYIVQYTSRVTAK